MSEGFRTLLAFKSIVVGLLVLCLWGRSYFAADQFRKGDGVQFMQLGSGDGSIFLTWGHDGHKTRLVGSWKWLDAQEPGALHESASFNGTTANRLGFGVSRRDVFAPERGIVVNVALPHWLVFLLAIPSAVRWGMRRKAVKQEQAAAGVDCPSCGFLFAVAPPVCPICGQAVPRHAR